MQARHQERQGTGGWQHIQPQVNIEEFMDRWRKETELRERAFRLAAKKQQA